MEIRQLFAAPVFADEEKTRRARVLHVIIWSILLVVNVQIISLAFAQPEHFVRWSLCVLVIDITLPVLLVLSRRGRIQLAGGFLVGILWLLITGMAYTAGGVHAPIIIANIVIVLIVGMLFGEGAGVVAAVVFSLTGLLFVWLEKEGHLPVSHVTATAPTLWITHTLFIALVASFQFLANRSIKDALGQARRELEERKLAEEELRENEERFREVYEATSDHIFLLNVMPDGSFYYDGWNPASERASGITSSELAGRTPEQLFPPDQARRVRANYQRCIDENRSINYEHALTFGGKLNDFNVTLFPVRNAAGKIRRVVGVAHNVTERKRAEAELRASEERFREVFEATSDYIFLLDVTAEGKFELYRWNPVCERAWGITSAEVAGKTPEQILPPDQARSVTAHYQRCVDQKVPINYEEFLELRGKRLEFQTTLIPVRNPAGRIHRIVGVAHNITEQKKAEAELRASEERFREVFEATSDYIFLLDVTPEGKYFYHSWNPTCERMAGLSSAELKGKTPEDLFPPDQARSVAAHYQRCIDKNASINYEEFLKLGPSNYTFHTTLIPVRNPAGRIHRIVGVSHNITEQKKAVAELRASEDRYRIVVEQTGQMVYEYDVASGRLSWRGAIKNLTGFSVEEFQEVNIERWEEMIHPEDRPEAMEAFHKAMEEVGEYHVEYRFRCKSGNYIDIEDHGLFLPDGGGKSHRMLGVMADITDRKLAEKALMQSRDELEERVQERTMELQKVNKELEAFTYSVSHDLRSPVRVVESFADLLIDDYAKQMPEEAQQFLGEIKTGAQRMSGLIQGLLRLSHVDREPFVPRCVNLKELANEVVVELKRELKGREMEIRVDHLPECLGDPALLRQFFVNLLSNAIKFTGTRPRAIIEVGCKEGGEKPICFVRDNGVGFDMQKADKLFGVFQRLHSPDEFAGTGVGLSIVQRIIHRHGGRIWAESEVDKGTTFYFTLPRCVESGE